jgi:hypothetical protein
MTEAKLRQMLQNGSTQESSFVERNPDHFKDREARKTVVAFANSTPEGQESIAWFLMALRCRFAYDAAQHKCQVLPEWRDPAQVLDTP